MRFFFVNFARCARTRSDLRAETQPGRCTVVDNAGLTKERCACGYGEHYTRSMALTQTTTTTTTTTPRLTQGDLLLPFIDVLAAAGGRARGKVVADALAERVSLDNDERTRPVLTTGGRKINAWDRTVRWIHQLARVRGLTIAEEPGLWALTDRANDALRNARPGVVVVIYESERGLALWGTAEAVEKRLEAGSLDLIVTSPPYPLLRAKEYGNLTERDYIEWLVERAAAWKEALADTGSLMLNLGDVWMPGQPTQSLYQERVLLRLVDDLGFHLAQRLYWHNPAKMPAPAAWVTVQRVRVTPAVESLFWLSKTANPKANNRNVLRPYSDAMRRTIAQGGTNLGARPSGHAPSADGFSADNGGSIPHALLQASNTASNDTYSRTCRERGLKIHPARFPQELPAFAIGLTTAQGDIVYDPFAGSLTAAAVAERMGRRWVASERSLEYLRAGLGRIVS